MALSIFPSSVIRQEHALRGAFTLARDVNVSRGYVDSSLLVKVTRAQTDRQ